MHIAEMTIKDHSALLDLMQRTPGIHVREADSKAAVERYLLRNPGLSFTAWEGEKLIGCAMCGHDGRRGYLQHVIVEPAHRSRGVAHQLVTRCLDQLEAIGILKTHIDVFVTNDLANRYWSRRGWQKRNDVYRYSYNRSNNADA
jgi:ribosomal protein S18 acetylase RimI-like enzyme